MNQYIITEKQLRDMVYSGTVGWSPYREKVADNVRSRPYDPQAERENVLDLIQQKCTEGINTFSQREKTDVPDKYGWIKAYYDIRDFAESLHTRQESD